ncbi:DUF2165 family protein [Shimia biformata]|uniref:DUF2165 family protein n=1 Tax=Shimia biformata TaxID=1294299 RepID=UPI001EF319BC|nr:DUF2165 family protein [Shimia biformata]
MTLFAQAISLALPAAWLTLGVRDNLVHPDLNETYTAEVLSQARMKNDYPEAYARVAHRSINSRTVQRAAFRLVVAGELSTVIVMWAGVIALLALGFTGAPDWARPLAQLGALMFTTIWAMFTVVGNHFSYWFCHEGAQNTHFQLALWGTANLIFLSL